MKLSAPIYALKSQAKDLKKIRNIPLSEALNKIAQQEGFMTWSLLMLKHGSGLPNKYSEILDYLNEGDIAIVAARPSIGKTTFAFGLVAQAIEAVRPRGYLFTLVEREDDARKRINAYNVSIEENEDLYRIDCSNDISSDYIISVAKENVRPGSLIIVDYIQILDQRRINPPIQEQIEVLKEFAKSTGCIIVFLCQVDRQVGGRPDPRPTIDDIRLPNPLDLDLFNKIIFLYRENPKSTETEVRFIGKVNHHFNIGFSPETAHFYDLAG